MKPIGTLFLLFIIFIESLSGQVRPADFKTSGSARFLDSSCVQLTPANYNQGGAIWFQQRINLNYDFDVTARINLGNIDGGGADGITFSMQPLSNTIGGAGGGIGIAGVKPSLAVEFDTWQNDDPVFDHIALIRDGDLSHYSSPLNTLQGPFPLLPNDGNAEDGLYRPVRFLWNAGAKRFQVWYDGVLKIDIVQDFVQTIFGGNPFVYWGFTAATGGALNDHRVCLEGYSVVRETDCYSADILQRDTSFCGTITLPLTAAELPPFALTCAQMTTDQLAGLIACYPFNGNAIDQSGGNHHGTVSGAVLAASRTGAQGSAFRFSGNSSINVDDDQSLRLMNSDFTINVWINPDPGTSGHMIYKGVGAGNNLSKYLFGFISGKLQFHINGPGMGGGLWFASQSLSQTGWFMATVIRRGAQIEFYVNGQAVGQLPFTQSIPNTTGQDLRIGGAEPNGSGGWRGILDDLTFHGRALSHAELEAFAVTRGRYLWSTGDTTRQIQFSTSIPKTVYLTVFEGSRQCRDSVRITARAPLSLVINPTGSASVCAGDSLGLSVSANVPGVSFKWSPSAGLSKDTGATVLASPSSSVRYFVVGKDVSGCSDTADIFINQHPKPNINIATSALKLCTDSSARLTALGDISSLVYTWSPTAGLSAQNASTVIASPAASTVYTVIGKTDKGCLDTANVRLEVLPPLLVNILPDSSGICSGESAKLTATSNRSGVIYSWSPIAGLSSQTGSSVVVSPIVTTIYRVIARDSNGCRATDSSLVRLFLSPTVDAGRDTAVGYGKSFTLMPRYSGDVNDYQWSPSNGLSCSACPSPVVTGFERMVYRIRVQNSNGCVASDSVVVDILCDESAVFIPNTFSPNGDGINDIFYPRGKGVKQVTHLRIYDRWGNMVFERRSFQSDDRSAGWDGKYMGKILRPGVFVYTVRMLCVNNRYIDLKGSLTIVE